MLAEEGSLDTSSSNALKYVHSITKHSIERKNIMMTAYSVDHTDSLTLVPASLYNISPTGVIISEFHVFIVCVYVCMCMRGSHTAASTTRQTRHLPWAPKQEGPFCKPHYM